DTLQVDYPGNLELEEKNMNIIRWNAMAMVVMANRNHHGIGGHISSFASCSTLYEVGFNHFFKGNGNGHEADQVFFQGHVSPGNYARAYFEGRLSAKKLHHFRQELAPGGGLSSYPHPYLMPDFWQFPTVSMGLGPILAIYQARFNRYLSARGILSEDNTNVWAFLGDGECDEPETLGALTLASRENLDNLTFIVNCNLQRLDGPVRGNGKMIQELEAVFRGAGWNVIKVVWGSNWDELLKSDHRELLIKRMGEAVDGDYQKYVVSPGSYFRKHFFGKYPELLELVATKTDSDLKGLLRGGHDPKKVYAAYKAAMDNTGSPTVILAKTVKGYGLGEAGEGKNISHNQKKLNEKELREFREKLDIPISDEDVVDAPFYRPKKDSAEYQYLMNQRENLGGFLPERKPDAPKLKTPDLDFFEEFMKSSNGSELSTTMAFVRMISRLLRHPDIGKLIVPIIPDEARTFGMESLFRQCGIYSRKGQLYEPVDSETLLYYREEKDGQILEEGINEAGSMSSFIAAGTSYATHGVNMIPFYIYYSMFGFQRVGDLMWLAADIKAKGFLLGGTSGRTTLNGEGLQHQDGHSHLLASTIPTIMAYDPAFRYEVAVIIQDGLRRMYQNDESIFYYITLCNENYEMPEMPNKKCVEGIVKGIYQFNSAEKQLKKHVQLWGSGTILREVIRAQELLKDFNVSADVWSVTNYKQLRTDALNCERWNMLNPTKKAKVPYIAKVLNNIEGPFIAASDNMKMVSDQVAPWVPGRYYSLGTDGLGRSDTRPNLRRFFEVDAECIVIATLYQLSKEKKVTKKQVEEAIKTLGVDPDKAYPLCI
ncbi:pyruvate dehydrogenase (acetyl-transferring), homodimeric type, partial [Candidatus Marinamargulisbacteria bacterium SCGC AG-410-N11]